MSTVTLTTGQVAGRLDGDVYTFRGIPYAAAPVGELRFAAPAPHPAWEGVRPALENGPTPTLGPEGDTHSVPEIPVPGKDKLNLNVFTPSIDPQSRLPVYVWIHGGGYVGGAPGGEWFDGTSFARRGIVVAALTYRLGFEGFGHIPGAPDNRGLLDQIAALRWVAENIGAFGGDAGAVTIGGQSAGGGAVLSLLGSAATGGLFTRAVSHSAPLPDITPEAAAAVGADLAKAVGVPHTVEGWSAVSQAELVQAERRLEGGSLWDGLRSLNRLLREREPITWFGPVLGSGPVGTDILTDLASGVGRERSLLLDATTHEFNHLAERITHDVTRGLSSVLLTGLGMPAVRARAYPAAFPEMSGTELVGQAVTDRLFRYPVVRVAGARAAMGAATWAWDFRWRDGVSGLATHCMDLPFAWNTLGAERVARLLGHGPPQSLAQDMHGAICRFITEGDPGWAPYTEHSPVARVWDSEPWTGRDPYRFERIAVQVERRR